MFKFPYVFDSSVNETAGSAGKSSLHSQFYYTDGKEGKKKRSAQTTKIPRTITINVPPKSEWQTRLTNQQAQDETHHTHDRQFHPTVQNHRRGKDGRTWVGREKRSGKSFNHAPSLKSLVVSVDVKHHVYYYFQPRALFLTFVEP